MPSAAETTHKADRTRHIPISNDLEEAIETVRECPCCGAPIILVPGLVCSHCKKEIEVKAFVYERRGVYYGECVTLNLVSRGDTQDEAIRRLQVAMFTYVQTVLSVDAPPVGLIPRRAPLTSWMRYYKHVFMARFSHLFGVKYELATNVFQTALSEEGRIVHC
jgi:predicted RNase H-like HicB family nuclease